MRASRATASLTSQKLWGYGWSFLLIYKTIMERPMVVPISDMSTYGQRLGLSGMSGVIFFSSIKLVDVAPFSYEGVGSVGPPRDAVEICAYLLGGV